MDFFFGLKNSVFILPKFERNWLKNAEIFRKWRFINTVQKGESLEWQRSLQGGRQSGRNPYTSNM